jgi:hypothetical protein
MFDTLPVDKIGVTNTRLTNLEYLGADMIEAGNEFGVGTPYGSALVRVGQTEQALGEIEREYIKNSHSAFCGPLQNFLEGEMKNIVRERRVLENRRLDLDSCKNKVRKARAMQLQPAVSTEVSTIDQICFINIILNSNPHFDIEGRCRSASAPRSGDFIKINP